MGEQEGLEDPPAGEEDPIEGLVSNSFGWRDEKVITGGSWDRDSPAALA
jgi:hypothetical protein